LRYDYIFKEEDMGVIDRLNKHILVDGFHVIADEYLSKGSTLVDQETKKAYIDCYSQFASQPLGWNHQAYNYVSYPKHKLANSDMYTELYADFVDYFSNLTSDFKHYFFIDGGALAVENALKAAFDWKLQVGATKAEHLDVVHFKEAFHGRTGYTMSLTNTDPNKIKGFPKFNWSRVTNPKIHFPADEAKVKNLEGILKKELDAIKWKNVAAIIVEPIQGEGGDNHFRKEFFETLRSYADKKQALLIFDEVQTGLGATGKMWAYEHFGVVPDLMCFGKKTQVCGFCSTDRIEQASENVFVKSSRINSTWGGNNFDMARAIQIFDAILNENLVKHAEIVGKYLKDEIKHKCFSKKYVPFTNLRGRGLMIAFDLKSPEERDEVVKKLQKNMLVLTCGKSGIRLRPHLDFPIAEVETVADLIAEAL
jgi:L-lysine 6-transaminase